MASPRARPFAGLLLASLLALGAGYAWSSRSGANEWAHVDSVRDDAPFQRAALIERAWASPGAASYRARFVSQPNGSFCGPTSLTNAIRSLGLEMSPDDVLEGTSITTLGGFLPSGITLDELADVARTRLPEHRVTVMRDLDLAAFRALLARIANEPEIRVVANFHRGPLFATGGGHHSPIGGYLADEDLVFVLDTNDSYEPWLAPTERVFEAIDTIDSATGRTRGLLVIEPVRGSAGP